jgi:hypothetical protein
MVASADGKTLFVANATQSYGSLPTGSVTAYQVGTDGVLNRLGSSALALSAVRPYALALSPDSSLLAVLSEGGVLSLVAVQPNGLPTQVVAVHKTLTTEHLKITFSHDDRLRLDDGTEERTFRASAQTGFVLISAGPSRGRKTTAFESFGVEDAKATLCVSA